MTASREGGCCTASRETWTRRTCWTTWATSPTGELSPSVQGLPIHRHHEFVKRGRLPHSFAGELGVKRRPQAWLCHLAGLNFLTCKLIAHTHASFLPRGVVVEETGVLFYCCYNFVPSLEVWVLLDFILMWICSMSLALPQMAGHLLRHRADCC